MRSRFTIPVLLAAAAAAVIGAWFALRGGPEINVILISVDTLRPDRLGCYGYTQAASPSIDRLSAEGVTFEDAVCSAPLTLPSHASMLTGLYPPRHGIRDNGSYNLDPDYVTLAEVFKRAGYNTAAFIGAFVLDSRYGLDQGFDVYDDDLLGGRKLSAFGYSEITADALTGKAAEWLAGAQEPFFAFLHYYDPHTPYEAPPEYRSRHPRSAYDAEIAFTDRELGRFLEALDGRGLTERTLIVFVSDHGEALGEHGEVTHGLLVYQPTLKVPFILRLPERSGLKAAMGRGGRIRAPVRLIDLMPTVLEIAGIGGAPDMDGRSLVPLIEGGNLPPEFSYFETMYPYFAFRWSPLRGVRFNEWKYTLAPTPELYDLSSDRAEARNLCEAAPERAAELRAAIGDILKLEALAKPSVGTQISAEEARRLGALGYVSRSPTPLPPPDDLTGSNPVDMVGRLEALLGPGEQAFDSGDMVKALEYFDALAEADPGNPEAHIRRGRTLIELGDDRGAEAALRRALEADSTNSTAYFHLGNIARGRGSMDEAMRYYRESLRLMPGSPEALANMGAILLEEGRADSAIVVLGSALAVDPVSETALINLGLAYEKLKMHDEALAAFQRLIKIDPAHAKALANCGAVYVAKGDADSMVYYFRAASRADPDNPQLLYNLGSAYRKKQMLNEAGECYAGVIEMQPDNVLALFGLAAVRATQGRRDEARALLERALEIDPDFELAANALRMLSSGD